MEYFMTKSLSISIQGKLSGGKKIKAGGVDNYVNQDTCIYTLNHLSKYSVDGENVNKIEKEDISSKKEHSIKLQNLTNNSFAKENVSLTEIDFAISLLKNFLIESVQEEHDYINVRISLKIKLDDCSKELSFNINNHEEIGSLTQLLSQLPHKYEDFLKKDVKKSFALIP